MKTHNMELESQWLWAVNPECKAMLNPTGTLETCPKTLRTILMAEFYLAQACSNAWHLTRTKLVLLVKAKK